ncbi:hypothetical protein SBA7_990012 [Candidatus Sulfotelmatobacter sp. SbA7]|nr:hypothetical protein SBA7_990012 [Candidatus Sulfotelmatobacter sp. SbA7]
MAEPLSGGTGVTAYASIVYVNVIYSSYYCIIGQ